MSSEWFQVDYISGLASWVFSIFLNHDVISIATMKYVCLPIFAGNALSWLWLISSILSSVHSDIWGGRTVTWLFDRFNEERHLSDPISLGSPISLFWLNKSYKTANIKRGASSQWLSSLHSMRNSNEMTIGKTHSTLKLFLSFYDVPQVKIYQLV